MRETVSSVDLEQWESNIILKALNNLKNNVESRDEIAIISELILKVLDAPEKKVPLNKIRKDLNER